MRPSKKKAPFDIARAFVDRINAHDVDRLVTFMTDDHAFIDASGTRQGPREAMKAGWQQYFKAFPDYLIEVDDVIAESNRVMITGTASGTHSGTKKAWKIPGAWKAVIRDGLVAEWRVWCDVEPMLRSMDVDRFAENRVIAKSRFTAKQGQYLTFIHYYSRVHGQPPAEREMQFYFRVSPPAVHDMILGLEKRGLIERTPGQARSIRLLVSRDELPELE